MMKCVCGNSAKMVTGKKIYPHRPDLYHKFFYHCEPCGSYVGCHPGTNEPLGTLANATIRKLRNQCHNKFDRLWKSGEMKRGEAYKWLQDKMYLTKEDAHIGKFGEEQCIKLLSILKEHDNE